MIPISDDNPGIQTPYTTYALIGLNVAAWLLIQGLGTEPRLTASICGLGLIPAELLQQLPVPPGEQIRAGSCVLTGGESPWYTLVTSMFLHGGWFHIIGNMWFLWIFGDNVEDSMGSARFAAFYLLCGLAAAAAQIVLNPGSPVPMVGASGAIGGVMGAYILLFPRVHVHMLVILGFIITRVAVPAVLPGSSSTSSARSLGARPRRLLGAPRSWPALVLVFRDPELLARHPYHGWKRRSPTRSWRRMDRW